MIESIYEFKLKRAKKCARNTSYENEKMESEEKLLCIYINVPE